MVVAISRREKPQGGLAMTKFTPSLLLASLLTLALHAAPAQALNTRSFISALGSDANPCTRPLPCRTLQTAHNNTNAGGEINMLDPAGYGAVIITKAISIVNDGVGSAGILVPAAGTGITINAGASDTINLRGLIIEGAGVGSNGIFFNSGKSLNITNCVVRGLTVSGIYFIPNTTGTSTNLAVSNSYFASSPTGMYVAPSGSGTTLVALTQIEMHGNSNNGLAIYGGGGTGKITAALTDSLSNYNNVGISVVSDTGQAQTQLMMTRSVTTNNVSGIEVAGALALVRLAQSTVTGNTNGYVLASGGSLVSYADNYIDGNLGSEAAPPTTALK
jgi:hypothetical protein